MRLEVQYWKLVTFSGLQGLDVCFQLIDGLHILVVLDAVEYDPAASLQINLSLLAQHGPDGNASVHILVREVEAANRASKNSSAFLFQLVYQLDGFDLWSS